MLVTHTDIYAAQRQRVDDTPGTLCQLAIVSQEMLLRFRIPSNALAEDCVGATSLLKGRIR